MKIRVTFKDPDALFNVDSDFGTNKIVSASKEEKQQIAELREREFRKLCSIWFNYGEYVTIEIDTDEKTAKILTAKEAEMP